MDVIRVPKTEPAAGLPHYWSMVVVFIAMAILQASVAVFSIQMMSTVRAYVTGESLYSKGQKDAQIFLLDYADRFLEEDYQRFMSSLAMPLGDRAARVTQLFIDGRPVEVRAATSAGAATAAATGTWNLAVTTDDGEKAVTLSLQQEGDRLRRVLGFAFPSNHFPNDHHGEETT